MSQSIHDFGKKIQQLKRKVEKSALDPKDKEVILGFGTICAAEGLTPARQWKLLEYIFSLATRYVSFSLHSATVDQIAEAVTVIESSSRAPWTKHDFKVAIRKFYKFVEWGKDYLKRDGYPESVAWISIRVKKRDQVRIQATDILTPEEVQKLIEASTNTQDKAFVSMTYELGARIGEIGSMLVGDVQRNQHGFTCDLSGKTGPRSVILISSSGALTAWLNSHPRRNDPKAPLWGNLRDGEWHPLSYKTAASRMRRIAAASGLQKRVYLHLLRHSRITHLLASGQLNEQQCKKFFGLVADSNMMATYAHLVSKDANDAMLRLHGITPDHGDDVTMSYRCPMCGEHNLKDNTFCSRCGQALSRDAALSAQERIRTAGFRVSKLLDREDGQAALRRMIREEIEDALSRALPPRSARSSPPTQERRVA